MFRHVLFWHVLSGLQTVVWQTPEFMKISLKTHEKQRKITSNTGTHSVTHSKFWWVVGFMNCSFRSKGSFSIFWKRGNGQSRLFRYFVSLKVWYQEMHRLSSFSFLNVHFDSFWGITGTHPKLMSGWRHHEDDRNDKEQRQRDEGHKDRLIFFGSDLDPGDSMRSGWMYIHIHTSLYSGVSWLVARLTTVRNKI